MARRFDHLADVEIFVAAAETGSFTNAARALATTPSVVTRAVQRLEARLGTQLIRRTTRSLSLTDPGRAYFEQAKNAFSAIDDAERAIQGREAQQTGRVRISVPSTYGQYLLPTVLREFSDNWPKVSIEVSIASRNVDLVAEGFDLAVRFGALPDSGLIARKLMDAPFCLVASRDYLQHFGVPGRVEDLAAHKCLRFIMPNTGRPAGWALRIEGRDVDWQAPGAVDVLNDFVEPAALAASGLGICQTYDFIARERLERGELVEVLPQLRGRSRTISIIYAPQRHLSAAARVLIEIMAARA